MPDDPINVVKEDPVRKGLLFAGSERAVYVSFDDGENWQSLRLNMPATSIRDLAIKDDDLVIGTHGRSFWILDNITPLRQLTATVSAASSILYKPQTATRVRWCMYPDTPIPQEEPSGENPPDGAMIDYYLKEDVAGEISLEIKDGNGFTVRKYSSKDTMYKIPEVNIPHYWIRPQQVLSNKKGHHRFLWDMKYAPLNVPASYPISAIYMNTEPVQTAPWVLPGIYSVVLTVGNDRYQQSFTVRMDPRVKTPVKDLQVQHQLSLFAYNSRKECMQVLNELAGIKAQVKKVLPLVTDEFLPMLKKLEEDLSNLESTPRGSKEPSFGKCENDFTSLFNVLQETDMPPTSQAIAAAAQLKKDYAAVVNKWMEMKKNNIKELNKKLLTAGFTPVSL